jgi:hypothetical protein
MRFIQFLLTLILWIDYQIDYLVSQTSTSDFIDLEDGHPNHQLWEKMNDLGRPPFSNR